MFEALLEMPGACGLRPSVRTHLKKALCYTRPVGGTEDKYHHTFSSLIRRSTQINATNKLNVL